MLRGNKNIFQIWEENGKKLPFAVSRHNWSDKYYIVIEKIEIKKFPYGNAYGFPVADDKYSKHYEYDSLWRKRNVIPCGGCYQWRLRKNVELAKEKLNVDFWHYKVKI